MQIYWIKAQAPLRTLAVAKHLGIEAEFIHADFAQLKSADYARLNPNLNAPTLVDGETVLWESSAINAWLCIKAGSDMWPAHDPQEQVQVLRWLAWNDQQWQRAVNPYYFEHIVKKTFDIGPPDPAELALGLPELEKRAPVLDAHLQDREFVACGRLTIADFQLGSMARYWREAHMPLERWPHIVRWLDRLMEIPAWANPWPEE